MKLLLINPKFPESFWSFSWTFQHILREKRALTTPLGLATIAALSSADWEIRIIDENVEPIDFEEKADLVGVCGMGVQYQRQCEILQKFRQRGCYVAAGGSYASLCPEDYEGIADTVISGEAELIWPEFCRDFERGTHRELYREDREVDLVQVPVPRHDLVKNHLYHSTGVQFSRGCPFRCEFCDIIVMFGRKPRTKALERMEQELDLVRALRITNLFFVDDNLIGHIPKCKQLLKFLAEYQLRHNYRFTFGTEASINMTYDSELLPLMKAANFEWVFIGIESPNSESLLETKKEQNTRRDLVQSIRTIYSHGLDVLASFIVGFDADDETIFEQQFRLIVDAGIVLAAVGLLMAIPSTPLYERMNRENRLRSTQEFRNIRNQFSTTNITPKQMTYEQLISGFQSLQKRLITDRIVFERISNKFRFLKNASVPFQFDAWQVAVYASRFFRHGLLPGGPRRWWYFLRSLVVAARNSVPLPLMLIQWTYAVAFKEFSERHVIPETQVTPSEKLMDPSWSETVPF